jgi:hypothetical protein
MRISRKEKTQRTQREDAKFAKGYEFFTPFACTLRTLRYLFIEFQTEVLRLLLPRSRARFGAAKLRA